MAANEETIRLTEEGGDIVLRGTRQVEFGLGSLEDVQYEIRIDKGGLLAMVDRAANNSTRRSSDGPITVKVKAARKD
jgi:hypothetical protein